MILAQLQNGEQTAVWAGASAFVLMLLGQFGKFLADWRKDRREREIDRAQREAETAANAAQQKALDRIVVSNEAQRDNSAILNVHLAKQEAVQQAQHEANLRELSEMRRSVGAMCKAECSNYRKKVD